MKQLELKINKIAGKLFSKNNRSKIANKWIKGSGIEIGALHNPLTLPSNVQVKYVDRMPNKDLLKHYPELSKLPLVTVDIIDNGETLSTIEKDSEDFLIANHMLEHCQNPIGTLVAWNKVLKPGGIAYISVPLKKYNFDHLRPITTWGHIVSDFENGIESSKEEHYREWCSQVEGLKDTQLEKEIERLIKMEYSIHFHVYTFESFSDFLNRCITEIQIKFSIEYLTQNQHEAIAILKKTS